MKTIAARARGLARHFARRRSLRYLVIGGTVYGIEMASIVAIEKLGGEPTVAVAVSYIIGTIISFLLQKIVTFGDKRLHHKVLVPQAIATGALILFNLGFTVLLTKLLQGVVHATVARTIALLITTIWNFYIYKAHIFRPEDAKPVRAERPGLLLGFDRVFLRELMNKSASNEGTVENSHDKRLSLVLVIATALILVILLAGSHIARNLSVKPTVLAAATQKVDKPIVKPRPAPAQVEGIDNVSCQDRAILQVVAHEDDDLLFINPDIHDSLIEGKCIKTVFLTAGDDGEGLDYALQREAGMRAAYANMLSSDEEWQHRTVMLVGDESVNVDSIANGKVELYFFRLPDGNLDGSGFESTGFVSMKKMLEDENLINVAIEESGRYSKATLTDALAKMIAAYQPFEVRTLDSTTGGGLGDHSDHYAASVFARSALQAYRSGYGDETPIRLREYIGYSTLTRPDNIAAEQQQMKSSAFYSYAQYDSNICSPEMECQPSGSWYDAFSTRRYEVEEVIQL